MNIKILAASFALVFLAELGDKTQLAALGFAASSRSPWSVFIGTSLALVCSSALAVVAGAAIGAHVPEKIVQIGAGVLFVLVGVFLLVNVARKAPEPVHPEPVAVSGAVSHSLPLLDGLLGQALAFEDDAAARLRETARCMGRDDLRTVLLQIADEEGGHHRHLQGMAAESGESTTDERVDAGAAPAPPEEFQLAKKERAPEAGKVQDCIGVLENLLRAEEAAAAFYLALARVALAPKDRRSLRNLAAQELEHAARLNDVLDQLRESSAESA